MAGTKGLPNETPINSDCLVNMIHAFIVDPKNSNTNWDNLNYKIDLPSSIDYHSLSEFQYAQVIAYRVLQKVWFKKQFATAAKQDAFEKKPLP